MKGIVLAGGTGSRLRPLTNYCLKLMAPMKIDKILRLTQFYR